MALKIINHQNTFKIEGEINYITVNNFDNHFKSLLKSLMNLTIDLSKVSHIDTEGKHSIRHLRQYAGLFKRRLDFILTKEQEQHLGLTA
jgi:ABC-type transporter Mla MlaB component